MATIPENDSNLYTIFNNIAEAIKSKGVSGKMFPNQMATKINQIITNPSPQEVLADITHDSPYEDGYPDFSIGITSHGATGLIQWEEPDALPEKIATNSTILGVAGGKDISSTYNGNLENIKSYIVEGNVGNIYKFQHGIGTNKRTYTMYLCNGNQETVYAVISDTNKTKSGTSYSVAVWSYDGQRLEKIFDTLDMGNPY